MISFFVVVTASLSESECKGRDFWDSGKMFGRVFAGFCAFSIVSDMFCGVWWGIRGKMRGFAGYSGEGNLEAWGERGHVAKALAMPNQGTCGG